MYKSSVCIFLLFAAACGGGGGSSNSTTSYPPFEIEMPVLAGESANNAYGLLPYGAHIGNGFSHLYDCGHPGWDVEFAMNASVRAAADGVVSSVGVLSDGRITVAIRHQDGRYQTDYTNFESVVVSQGQNLHAGDPIGLAGGQLGVPYAQSSFYMTHFQLDDFTQSPPYPQCAGGYAVSPEAFLSSSGQILFNQIWQTARYVTELSEPFASLPKDTLYPFPITRTWSLQTQNAHNLPARVDFIYQDPATDPTPGTPHDYALYDALDNLLESGSVSVVYNAQPYPTIDLTPTGQLSATWVGIYDIVGGVLTIDWDSSVRPSDLSAAAVYTTSNS